MGAFKYKSRISWVIYEVKKCCKNVEIFICVRNILHVPNTLFCQRSHHNPSSHRDRPICVGCYRKSKVELEFLAVLDRSGTLLVGANQIHGRFLRVMFSRRPSAPQVIALRPRPNVVLHTTNYHTYTPA